MSHKPENSGNKDLNKKYSTYFLLPQPLFMVNVFQIDMSFVMKISESQVFKAKRNAVLVR